VAFFGWGMQRTATPLVGEVRATLH
jgi:hypothetical protein